MKVKRKDFQKAAALVHEFLLKLSVEPECAELRDALNLTLLHMQRYYRLLRNRHQTLDRTNGSLLAQSLRGLSPMTPFRDTPDKFQWRWLNLDNPKLSGTLPTDLNDRLSTLPQVIIATKEGNTDSLVNAIERDPDSVLEVDGFGRNVLAYAVHFSHLDILQIILDHNVDINSTANDGSTAVHRACHDSHHEALEILLSCGANAEIQDVQGRAPIHWACTTKNRQCLEILVNHGVNVRVQDREGMTPSMWACRMDNIEHLEVLERAVGNSQDSSTPLERDTTGKTWLHWSLRRTEPLECLSTLLTEDSVLVGDSEGKTVMHAAAEMGSLPAIKLIMDTAGPECLGLRDLQNRTPLMLATLCGHGEVVNYLLSQGADLAAVDDMNATAWAYAQGRQLHYCQLILASYIRERGGEEKTDGVDQVYNINELQIGREGSTLMEHTNRPQQVPKAPRPPITPRSENGMRHRPKTPITPRASSGLDAPEDQSYPIPPTPRGRDNHYKTMVNHDQGGVKRSPSGTESSGDEPAFDKNIRSSVAVNKRRKNEMMSERGISVMSIGSIDDVDESPYMQNTGVGPNHSPHQSQASGPPPLGRNAHHENNVTVDEEREMPSETHYVEGNQGEAADEKSVESIDNMEVSDFEEGGSLADEEGEVEGSHERREHVPKKNVSPPPQSNRSTVSQPHQHTSPMHHTHSHYYDAEPQHQPHPPPAPPQYTPYQSSESPSHHSYHPGPQEYVEAVEEEDLSQEAYYPTPSPRTTKGSPTQGSNKHAPYAPASEVETAESDQKDRPDSASTLVSDNKKSPITPETTSQAANQQILPPPSPLLNPLKGTPKLAPLLSSDQRNLPPAHLSPLAVPGGKKKKKKKKKERMMEVGHGDYDSHREAHPIPSPRGHTTPMQPHPIPAPLPQRKERSPPRGHGSAQPRGGSAQLQDLNQQQPPSVSGMGLKPQPKQREGSSQRRTTLDPLRKGSAAPGAGSASSVRSPPPLPQASPRNSRAPGQPPTFNNPSNSRDSSRQNSREYTDYDKDEEEEEEQYDPGPRYRSSSSGRPSRQKEGAGGESRQRLPRQNIQGGGQPRQSQSLGRPPSGRSREGLPRQRSPSPRGHRSSSSDRPSSHYTQKLVSNGRLPPSY